jgi:RND family efflux transporter MFP subunit
MVFMSRRTKLLLGAVAALIVIYLGVELALRARARRRRAKTTLEQSVRTVSVIHATRADPMDTVTLPGNITAWYEAPIYAQVSGYVKMWYKDYGAQVKKGDVLAEIYTPTLDAQTRQAKADMLSQRAKYELAALTAKRYEAMRESKAVSVQSISVNEANARAERAQLNAAQSNVGNFAALQNFKTIVAPYDGVVIGRYINVGDYVNKEGYLGQSRGEGSLFTIADVHKARLFVSVPERFGQFLKAGLKAEVRVPQLPERRFEAEFLTVARGFDPTTRTAITEFVLNNEDGALWPGSYALVHLSAPLDINRLSVPTTALVFQENGLEVATVTKDNRVHFKAIKVTKIREGTVDVDEGITAADAIIDNPSAGLLERSPVRVVKPREGYEVTRDGKTYGAPP